MVNAHPSTVISCVAARKLRIKNTIVRALICGLLAMNSHSFIWKPVKNKNTPKIKVIYPLNQYLL